MDLQGNDPAEEIKRLQRGINDLVSLSAAWSGSEPSQIVQILLDSLLRMLSLDFIYSRLRDPVAEVPMEVLRVADSYKLRVQPEKIHGLLSSWVEGDFQKSLTPLRTRFENEDISIFPVALGLQGEIGTILVGSERQDFPTQTESLLLSIAANQASIGLQEARLLNEQKRVAKELRAIISTIPILAWSASPDGSADFLNQRWLDYTGMTAEQAYGWGWHAAIHPDDLKGLGESRLASGVPVEAEARMRRFDGAYRWFLFRANPLKDESGKIVEWYGTNIDIEDRKQREEALRARELSWREIVDNIPGLVATQSAMGEVEFLNRQTLEYFGKTTEELKNWALIGAVHPDDLPFVIEARTRSIETGQIYNVEHRCRRADGVFRWFQVRGLPVRDAKGAITDWYLLLTDIDDRKRAEEELKRAHLHLTEAQRLSKTGSFISDLLVDDHVWSKEALRICEFDPAAKVTVQMFRNIIHPEDLPSFDAAVARGMEGADADFVFRIVTSRGALKHLRGIAHVVEKIAGRPVFSGALQDVTESKVAEEALNRARSELAHVARVATLSALTASIAHEVNQPLSGIITNASTCLRMLDGDPPNVDGARETAQRTIRDGKRASDVITRLRALFSKKEFTPEPLNLNEATREVIALSLSDLQRNQVILRSELAVDLPPVTGDRTQLQQVILNLLRNASDAMSTVQDRPRELLIKTQRDEEDRVRLSVKDVGVGFEPQVADRLFQAFYTTKNDGMGIGLSVCRSIIEAHHGQLGASPNNGPGATFSFSIPCRPDTKVQ